MRHVKNLHKDLTTLKTYQPAHPRSLISLRSFYPLVPHRALSEDSDHTTWLIWVCWAHVPSCKFCCVSRHNFSDSKHYIIRLIRLHEPAHDKTNTMACAPSEDSDQPGYRPSLIRVFTVRMKKAWGLSYPLSAQRRLWSDWTDAQADLSLRWAHIHFVGFVVRRLTCPDFRYCTLLTSFYTEKLFRFKPFLSFLAAFHQRLLR